MKKSHLEKLMLIFFVTVVAVLLSGGNQILDAVVRVVSRIAGALSGTVKDGSTIAHMSYYTFLPAVWSEFNLVQILFGYSYGWTGGMFFYFFGDTHRLIFERESYKWGVESDPMNTLYGQGLVGLFFLYRWLFNGISRGIKLNKKYGAFLLAIVISGIFYCIQYNFVVITELMLIKLIYDKRDLFTSLGKVRKEKIHIRIK